MASRPDYNLVNKKRQERFLKIVGNEKLIKGAHKYYSTRPVEFIDDWCVTYDPRNIGTDFPTLMPFVLFKRQKELIRFLYECSRDRENGAIEKCRDAGATWVCCAFSIWLLLFSDGGSIGWGSRKETLVDKIGDPDSIFEKMRILIKSLPSFFIPKGYKEKEHASYMRIINTNNSATITGESGDNIGRGGRKSIYFKDEAQPLDSLILTPSGWETMGCMEVGKIISHPYDKTSKVTQIKDFEECDIYEITFKDGTKTECSPNHLWEVKNVFKKNKIEVINAKMIADSYKYISPGGQIKYKYKVPVCNPLELTDTGEDLPLHPYIVGALIGDGSVSKVTNATPGFTSADPQIVEEIRNLLPEGCVINKVSQKYGYSICDEIGVKSNRFNRSRARKAVYESGISGCLSYQKFIPDKYKFSSIENRLSLVQGLMDTDGSASGKVASFHTSSPKLAKDVLFVVRSLGGNATYNVKPNPVYRDMYVLHIALPEGMIPFRLGRKINQLPKRTHSLDKTILSVSLKRKDKVRCISVDKKDGLYITNGFTTTHNSAHYERPEKIEAALGDNTNVQIDISSVNGPATVFQRRVDSGEIWYPDKEMTPGSTRVFIFDWKDHPMKDQAWYDKRKRRAEVEGLSHIFAQEVDRDSSAAVEGVLIPMTLINSAINAHEVLDWDTSGTVFSALDLADEGRDRHALATRKSVVLKRCIDWHYGDVGETTRKAMHMCMIDQCTSFQYDNIGVGAGAKSETNRLKKEKIIPKYMKILGWCATASPLNKHGRVITGDKTSPKNIDFFANLKAQGWWELKLRFERTHKAITEGAVYPVSEMISLSPRIIDLEGLKKEISQPTYSINGAGKVVVDKNPDGSKSPNRADAVMMVYHPVKSKKVLI